MLLAQAMPQLRQQGIVRALGQVVDVNQMCVPLATRRTDRNEKACATACPGGSFELGAQGETQLVAIYLGQTYLRHSAATVPRSK